MRTAYLLALLAVVAGMPACHLQDGNRCDDGQTFDGMACLAIDTDTESDTGIPADGGADAGTGMMTPCDGPEDCAGLVASFCLDIAYMDIVLNGCVIADCTVAPDSCPEPNTCCDLDPSYEGLLSLPDTLCMPPEYWSEYSSFCVNA